MAKTNLGLVEYVKSKLGLKTIYMLGGFGRILTQTMIDRRINMGCPHTIRNLATIKEGIGRYCFDCVGLIKGYLWEISPGRVDYNIPKGSDQNVGMMYNSCTQKGVLMSMPDILGLLVFTKDLGHVGVYIGKDANGKWQYVECTPAWGKWGVCQSNDEIRTWAFWGKYHLIEYVELATEPIAPKLKFKAGQRVVLNGRVYRNSLMGGPGAIFSNRVGFIRFLVDEDEVPAPYHIDGLGWVKEESLTLPTSLPNPITVIKAGSKVKIIGSHYATGEKVPFWVKLRTHTVASIAGSNARLKEINSWVYLKDLKRV